MRTRHVRRLVIWTAGCTLALLPMVGCASAPRRNEPAPPPPVVEPETPTDESPPLPVAPAPMKPSEPSQPAGPPAATRPPEQAPPVEPPEEAPPPLPHYIRVLERFDNTEPAQVQYELVPPRRLLIETRNVSRLRILRNELPLAIHRSIVLRLDDQGIEWTRSSTATVFERSVNGVWSPLKPTKSER